MKKHNTFKIVLGTMLIFAVLSWIIPAAYYSGAYYDQGRVQAGLFDLFNYSLTSLSYFGYIALFVIFVGGFYGILNKIPAYRSLLDALANKAKGKEKVVLSVIMVLLAVIISVWGIDVEMLVFAPFIISLVLLMGFDKVVAALTIVGSSLVGVAGSTYAYGKIGQILYTLGLDINSDVYVKMIILLVGLVLLIFNTLLYIKKNESNKVVAAKVEKKEEVVEEVVEKKTTAKKTTTKTTKSTSKSTKSTGKATAKKTTTKKSTKSSKSSKSDIKAAVKDDEVIVVKNADDTNGLIPEKKDAKQKVWPMATAFALILVLVLLAFFPWSTSFTITWFEEAATAVSEFELFGFPIFGALLGSFNAFGSWYSSDLMIVLAFSAGLLALIYRVSLTDVLEGFGEGAKKALAPAGMIILIYTILVLTTYHPFQLTIYKALLSITDGFNVITSTIVAALAGLFNSDAAYAFQSVLPYFTSVVTNTEIYSMVGVLFQAVYGITMLVAPTGLVLMVVLTYLDLPYTKWLKNVWKFVLEFLAIVIIVALILILL